MVNFKHLQLRKKSGKVFADENNFRNDCLFLIPRPINKTQANIQARLARHAKLSSSSSRFSSLRQKLSFGQKGRFNASRDFGSQSGMATRFLKRVASVSTAFFIVSSLSLFDYFSAVQGYEGFDGQSFAQNGLLSSEEAYDILPNVSEEDGFVIKPNLTTEAGDRSTSNDIFAYKVEAGDTVASIAEKFKIKADTIMMVNGFYDAGQLKEGMTINVLPVDGVNHVVQKGETISTIAKKYNVKVEDIMRQNKLEESDPILANATLVIPGGVRVVPKPAPKPTYVASSGKSSSGYVARTGGNTYSDYSYSGSKTAGLIFPAPAGGILTQNFHGGHPAIDFANRAGGPIVAAAAGKVIKADYGWNGGYGNAVIIDHGDGMQTLYAHNKVLYVKVGDKVEQGDHIADMGNTGNVRGVTGIHTHFEVRINGRKYPPLNFVKLP